MEKREKKEKRKRERDKERGKERFAAATAAGRARAPVGRDARDEGKQEDVTAVGSDVGIGSGSGDRAEKMIRAPRRKKIILTILFLACVLVW